MEGDCRGSGLAVRQWVGENAPSPAVTEVLSAAPGLDTRAPERVALSRTMEASFLP